MVILLTVLAFSSYKSYRLAYRINPDMSTLSLVRDLGKQGLVKFQEYGFDFAFKLWAPLDPSIGYFEYNHIDFYYEIENGVRNRKKKFTPLKTRPCTYDDFARNDEEQLRAFGIESYLCAEDKKFEL